MEAFVGDVGRDREGTTDGRNQRTQKCLSSPLVNNSYIVSRKLRHVNADLSARTRRRTVSTLAFNEFACNRSFRSTLHHS